MSSAGTPQLAREPRGWPSIVTVVLNTNRRDDTLECLASLHAQTIACRNQVLVLDNQSHDGSADAIRRRFPDARVIALQTNDGYAGNNNVGIREGLRTGADWLLILNEDTVLHPECLEQMIDAAAGDPRIGVVGPLVLHHDEPDVVQSAGGHLTRFWEARHHGANETDRGQYAGVRDVDWVSGCALLIKRDAVAQIGLLNERFYYYWEETEWCVRARRAGWRVVNVATARLWHKGVTRDYRPSTNVAYYNTRNRLLLLSIHRAPLRVWAIAGAQTLRTLISLTVRPKWRHAHAHRDAVWQGLRDFLSGRWGARAC
jgi:GT2 family glycosyltransferase